MNRQSGLPREAGQAVLIILLTMTVALTVVLSIIAATTSDIKISSNETSSLRAFSAAESGIEKALLSNSGTSGTINNANFTSSISGYQQGKNHLLYPNNLNSGENATLWFVSHDSNGNLTCSSAPCFTGHVVKVCWGTQGTSPSSATTPAIEISAYYLTTPGNYTTVKLVKAIYDPNSGRIGSNSYAASDAGTCTLDNVTYAFQKQFDLGTLGVPAGSYGVANGLQFMTAKILYNSNASHPVGFSVNFAGDSTLPSQGNLIDSTGNLSDATRKVEVTRVYNGAPPVFDAAVFSPGGLTQ